MNILIVDDDAYVIEALQKGMDWKSIDIDNVYTSYNVKNAKKILESIPIHVLLCDIEMPKENGFALIEWIHEKNLIIQNIFLTSYGEFDYASHAVELQAFRYVLKPIAYDKLGEIVKSAVEKEKQALKATDYRKGYESWVDTEKNRKDSFWQKLFIDKSLVTISDISKHLKEMDLRYKIDDNFLCLTLELFHSKKIMEEIGKGMLGWKINNIVEEVFSEETITAEGIIRNGKARWIVVLHISEDITTERLEIIADNLIQKVVKQLRSPVCCGIGNVCIIGQLAENLDYLNQMCEDNVIRENKILFLSQYEYKIFSYVPPNFNLWETLLSEAKEEALLKAIHEYLAGIVSKQKVNKEVLYQFMMDFLQLVFSILKQKHIMLHGWQYDQFQSEMSQEAAASVNNMRLYIETIVKDVIKVLKYENDSKSVIDVVKEYIDDNIDKEISRESLAKLVYLNPDYLARLFKKEAGDSLVNYITNRRIDLAKEYFETTEEPVNAVALKVGYDNFSYFSKVFKEVVGISPKDYKNRLEE